MTNTIVLSAGNHSQEGFTSGAMTPVRGLPAISWCLKSVLENNVKKPTVIIRKSFKRLDDYLNSSIFSSTPLEIVHFNDRKEEKDSILYSLHISLKKASNAQPTQIILGDTVIGEKFPEDDDVFLASDNFQHSRRWCLVSLEKSHIKSFYEKENTSPDGKLALVGYYKLSDTKLLKECVEKALHQNKTQLSDAFTLYNLTKKISVKNTKHWNDLGHISGIVETRISLFNAREFNNIKVNQQLGTIIKKSEKKQKLEDEMRWYLNLPKELSPLAPRVINFETKGKTSSLEMELFGYSNLAEYFVYGNENHEDWLYILDKLFDVHKLMDSFKAPNKKEELEELYINKTIDRISQIKKQHEFKDILSKDYITINGKEYKNLPLIEGSIIQKCEELAEYDEEFSVVHGDYCFSNILFDPMHYVFRLIDPRGRFKTQTIYSDPRYDYAKLRHSLIGLYDFIVLGLYNIRETASGFELKILCTKDINTLKESFDTLLKKNGFNIKEIALIEALLFLTMIPFHSDDTNRQKSFYLIAIKKLNEVMYG